MPPCPAKAGMFTQHTALDIHSSYFMHQSIAHSFLLLGSSSFYEYISACLVLRHCKTAWCLQFGTITGKTDLYTCTGFCLNISVPMGKYLGVQLLDYMLSLCLTFTKTAKMFSGVAKPFYILTNMHVICILSGVGSVLTF